MDKGFGLITLLQTRAMYLQTTMCQALFAACLAALGTITAESHMGAREGGKGATDIG